LATVVQVMDSIGHDRGGLTKAVFERFRLLSEETRSILVTVAYQPNVRKIFNELVANGSLPAHCELLNYFEDQRANRRFYLPRIVTPHADWEALGPFQGAEEPTAAGSMIRYFRQGIFKGLVFRESTGRLRHVDVHDESAPWTRLYRDTTWSDGSIARREYYDSENKPRFRIYIDSSLRAFLSVWVSPEGYEYRTIEHGGDSSEQHGDMRAANAAWLGRKLEEIGSSVVYTDEPRTTFALVIQNPSVKHVTSIHTTHNKNNIDTSEGLKYWVDHYTKNEQNISKLIFFTKLQAEEFIASTSFREDKIDVVPHYAPLVEAEEVLTSTKNPNELVIVSRLAADKRIGDAISAFAGIVKKNHQAKLNIWGTGPESTKLQKQIDHLGLKGNVTLCGRTDAPLSKFAAAQASVVTSRYEGFGLVITESMSCGTPVVAYDVPYGPRDILGNGVGFLVEDGNIDALSAAMEQALANDEFMRNQIVEVREKAMIYSYDNWVRGWESTMLS